ncbi:hypothetical protein BGZ83_006326, partial [Gryganskiella cystojenkinii]
MKRDDVTAEQNYSWTLTFSIPPSIFTKDGSDTSPPISRTFHKISPNLSHQGYWNCIFTESKNQQLSELVNLDLALVWLSRFEPEQLCQASSPDHQADIMLSTAATSTTSALSFSRDKTRQQQEVETQELVSRIKTMKVRSDATLSVLQVEPLDGRGILEGRPVHISLQPSRILRNGYYMFRVAFYTQDISQCRPPRQPLFASFLDINPEFDPSRYRPHESTDICFKFPKSQISRFLGGRAEDPQEIHAHASILSHSPYFTQLIANTIQREKDDASDEILGFEITEFGSEVFCVLLRYLYTGRIEMLPRLMDKGPKNAADFDTRLPHPPCLSLESTSPTRRAQQSTPDSTTARQRIGSITPVHFEDLYRIADRYEVQDLKALSLKAIQCNLDMTIAVSMLAKLPYDACQQGIETQGESFGGQTDQDRFFRRTQTTIAADLIREYVQFYSTKVDLLGMEHSPPGHLFSVQERRAAIREIGD